MMMGFEARRTAGNEATSLLKLLALVSMFCDHAGKMLLPQMQEMRIIGRIAFPVYCWCLVVGVCYTRNVWKYMLRLLAVGLISQPLYMLALNHKWTDYNIFLTLLLGLGALWGIREKKAGSQWWAPALALVLAVVLKANYGWKGIAFILMLYACRTSRPAIAAMFCAFCLYWGSTSAGITSLFGTPIILADSEVLNTLLGPWLRLQALAILALPLILWQCPLRWKLPAWAGYLMYPAHLLVLFGLEKLCGI